MIMLCFVFLFVCLKGGRGGGVIIVSIVLLENNRVNMGVIQDYSD